MQYLTGYSGLQGLHMMPKGADGQSGWKQQINAVSCGCWVVVVVRGGCRVTGALLTFIIYQVKVVPVNVLPVSFQQVTLLFIVTTLKLCCSSSPAELQDVFQNTEGCI